MSPKLLICGMEHTGTTLISDLFRQVPGLDSGFESGVLLRPSPREFQGLEPFYSNMLKGWDITEDELAHCCDTDDFDQFYGRLMAASRALADDTTMIFDKTPRYLAELDKVLERSSCPIVVSHKDPRAIVCSDYKRAKTKDFNGWYMEYRKPKLNYVQNCYDAFIANRDNPRVTTVGLEELAMNSRATMERMFAHAGEPFELGYAIIDTLRYKNVKNRTVSADITFEFKSKLGPNQQRRIMEDFGKFDAWIYE
ncbi:MAG: sulfotransferase family protein [Octadecabacter sp.]